MVVEIRLQSWEERASVFHDEKSSGDWMCSNVNVLNTAELRTYKGLKRSISYHVHFATVKEESMNLLVASPYAEVPQKEGSTSGFNSPRSRCCQRVGGVSLRSPIAVAPAGLMRLGTRSVFYTERCGIIILEFTGYVGFLQLSEGRKGRGVESGTLAAPASPC